MMAMISRVEWWRATLAVLVVFALMPSASKADWLDDVKSWFADEPETSEADDDGDEESAETGSMQVRLDAFALELANIKTTELVESSYAPEIHARAQVLDAQPLLMLRSRYNEALATNNVAEVNAQSAARELERLRMLSERSGSVATKNVNQAEALWQEANARLQGTELQIDNIRNQAVQNWGEVIAGWVLDKDANQFQRLLTRRDSLLLVTMPGGQSLPAPVNVIRVAASGNRDQARKAYFVSPAHISDQGLASETYYFKLETARLRSGMRLDAWIPQDIVPIAGVMIPDEAIVWYAGQPWTYSVEGPGHFQRRSLEEAQDAPQGMFVTEGLQPGDEIVMRGGQILLSEEFSSQIPDEDDD